MYSKHPSAPPLTTGIDGQALPDAGKPTANAAVAERSRGMQSVMGNIVALGSSEIGARVIGLAGMAYLTRRLGPEGFGAIGFALALASYFGLIVSAGFNDVGSKEVSRRPDAAAAIATSVILVRLILALGASLVLIAIVGFIHKPLLVRWVLLLTGLSFWSLALDTGWVYKGLERSRSVGVSLLLTQAVYVSGLFLLVRRPDQCLLVPPLQFAGEMAGGLLLAVPLLRTKRLTFDLHEGWCLAKVSSLRMVSRVLRTLIYSFDIILIGFWQGEYPIGLYSAAYRVCFLILALAYTIYIPYLPALTRAAEKDTATLSAVAGRAVGVAAAFGAPLVAGGIVVAGPVLRLLFGPGFEKGAGAFALLLISIGFVFLHVAIRNILLVLNRLKTEMWIIFAATVLNIGLNLLLIGRYGIVGAAFATAAAEGTIFVLGMMILEKAGIRLNMLSALWRPLLAAAAMAGVLFFFTISWPLLLQILLGGAVYIGGLVALGGVPEDVRLHCQPWLHGVLVRYRKGVG